MSAIAFHDLSETNATALPARFAALCDEARPLDSKGLLALALRVFPGRLAAVSSFAAESVVLLHHLAQLDPSVPVLFLNTGKLFGETLRYRDRLQDVLGLMDVRAVGPHPLEREAHDPDGALWRRDADACCRLRKVAPLRRALRTFDAFVTGRKRFQTAARATMDKVELVDARLRFNPLVDWSQADLARYIEEHRLPKHPLLDEGYPSIGCIPCTRRVTAGESYRDGRWPGLNKDECGIHSGMDGDGI